MARSQKTSAAIESENTELWNSLKDTPAEYLKPFKKAGGFSGSSIDPVYRIRRLTEAFGPCGKGWGFVQEDQFSDGGSGAYVVYVRGHLWYIIDGERYQTCSHTGGTVCDRAPDEAYKMAETDALGKCCVDIGLSVDVYMGEHDGDKYQRPESGPVYAPNAANAGRKAAGTNPTSAAAAAASKVAPTLPIKAEDVPLLIAAISSLGDEPDAMAYSRNMFKRLLASTELPPKDLGVLVERLMAKRCELATLDMVGNLESTIAAFVKAKWVTEATGRKNLELVKRRLGIPPDAKEETKAGE